jgi:hypothetical protein
MVKIKATLGSSPKVAMARRMTDRFILRRAKQHEVTRFWAI